jgi:hypothetical protein
MTSAVVLLSTCVASPAQASTLSYDYPDPVPGTTISHDFYFVELYGEQGKSSTPLLATDAQQLLSEIESYYRDQTGWDIRFQLKGFASTKTTYLCTSNTLESQANAQTAANALGKPLGAFDPGKNAQLVMVHNGDPEECAKGGMTGSYAWGGNRSYPELGKGIVGGGGFVETTSPNMVALAHEFGHNFGLGHSNASTCVAVPAATNMWDENQMRSCSESRYGDKYELMGLDMDAVPTLGATRRWELGLLNTSQYTFLDGNDTSAEVTLNLPSADAQNQQVAIVTNPSGSADVAVERRPEGVFILRIYDDHDTSLISAAGTNRQPLPVGSTYRTIGSTVTVTVVDSGATWSRVRITRSHNFLASINTNEPGLSDNEVTISATGGSNDKWKVSTNLGEHEWAPVVDMSDESWLTASTKKLSNGEIRLHITASENATSKQRIGKITLTSKTNSTVVWVPQAGSQDDCVGMYEQSCEFKLFTGKTAQVTGSLQSASDSDYFKLLSTATGEWRLSIQYNSTDALLKVQGRGKYATSWGTGRGPITSTVDPDTPFYLLVSDNKQLSGYYSEFYTLVAEPVNPTSTDPQGNLNDIAAKPGGLWVRGWAADEDAASEPIQVKVSIGGELGKGETFTLDADLQRTDIPRTYPQFGEYHGFNKTLATTKRGEQKVYVYAVNSIGTGGASEKLIATRTVNLGSDPQGNLNNIETRSGGIWVRGWAADNDAPTTPIQVKVSVGGELGTGQTFTLDAKLQRTDIPRTYPQFGEYHGYNQTLTTQKRGQQQVYVYAVNAAGTGGADKLIATKTISITG